VQNEKPIQIFNNLVGLLYRLPLWASLKKNSSMKKNVFSIFLRTSIFRLILIHSFLILSILVFTSNSIGQDTLVIRPGPAYGQDCELRTNIPNTPLGWSPSFCSDCWTSGGAEYTTRGLIRFDLSAIPSNSYITKAVLSLYCDPNATHYHLQSGDNKSYLSRVTQHWNQDTVTWNTQPNTTLDGAIILPTSTSNTQNYPDIDVTLHVRDMVYYPETNFGWKLQLITEELYRSMEFASSNDNTVQYRPKLTIISECQLPVAGFTYTIQYPEIHFTDTSHHAQSWNWDFGDGYQSTLKNPIHTYDQPGKYLTCLTITDSCGSDMHCDTIYFCEEVNTRFSYKSNGHFVSFTDSSFNPSSWYWNFGDQVFSTLQNPTHYFGQVKSYFVCLTSANACNTDTYCDSIAVILNAIDDITESNLLVYPNPATNKIIISNNKYLHQTDKVSIYTISGVLVKSFHFQNEHQMEIDVSNLMQGIYLVKMQTEIGIEVKKLLIQ
jgi:PKD repeat protein